MKSGNLNFLEPSGSLQACNGTAVLFNPLAPEFDISILAHPVCKMWHRPNESFVPEQQRKKYVSVVYGWRKNEWQESGAADKHQVCAKIGKSASEKVALLA
jgi:hypothetical protein